MPYSFPDTVETIEAVPEKFRSFYAENNGVPTLRKDDPTVLLAATTIAGQFKALNASREDVKKLNASRVDLSPLSDYGTTIEEIRTNFTAKIDELAKAGKGSSQAELDKLKASMTAGFESEKKRLTEQVATANSMLYEQMVVSAATQALAEHKGEPALLLPVIKAQVKVGEVDGKPVVHVLGNDGQPRYSELNPGEHMGVNELVREMRASPTYGRAFVSDNNGGGGSGKSPNPGVKSPGTTQPKSSMDKISSGLRSMRR